jgi:hypothetical protein
MDGTHFVAAEEVRAVALLVQILHDQRLAQLRKEQEMKRTVQAEAKRRPKRIDLETAAGTAKPHHLREMLHDGRFALARLADQQRRLRQRDAHCCNKKQTARFDAMRKDFSSTSRNPQRDQVRARLSADGNNNGATNQNVPMRSSNRSECLVSENLLMRSTCFLLRGDRKIS